MTTTSSPKKSTSTKSGSKLGLFITKWKRVLIPLPYVVGICWACLHSTSSILTGHFTKPRGWYIDENSLETSNLRTDYRYHPTTASAINTGTTTSSCVSPNATLCQVADALFPDKNNLECHTHHNVFDVVRIIPVANTLEPSQEAIVLVVDHPAANNENSQQGWMTGPLHISLLDLLRRLASSDSIPWLSKTVLLVSPTHPDRPLEEVVHFFLESYMGPHADCQSNSLPFTLPPLPLHLSDAMIRNLIVIDTQPIVMIKSNNQQQQQQSSLTDDIIILSQGKRGVLPNMDLVNTAMSVFRRAPINPSNYNRQRGMNGGRVPDASKTPTLFMHPHTVQARKWEAWVQQQLSSLPDVIHKWSISTSHLLLFCYHLYQGPHAPHALALERGIDAITIQGRYHVATSSDNNDDAATTAFVANFVSKLEVTLRGLSNLHERLHHSTPLYLLPSPSTFVKHEEYLVPNLLLLIPIVLRAAFLGLQDITRFNLPVMGWIVTISVVATIAMDSVVAHQADPTLRNTLWFLFYAVAGAVLYEKVIRKHQQEQPQHCDYTDALRSAQLILSLMTIYLHVPICFQNVSLSYPSAAWWAPAVAFCSFSEYYQSNLGVAMTALWIVVSWPPTLLLSSVFSDTCTVYIRFLYVPLHLSLSLSLLLGVMLRPKAR